MMRLILLFTLIFLAIAPAVCASDEISRRVLALYDSQEQDGAADTCFVRRYLEAPLNRLGMVVDYADVAQPPLPDPRAYRAVVVWFADDKRAEAADYCRWLAEALTAGVRGIFLNGIGAGRDSTDTPIDPMLVDEVLEAWGLRRDPEVGLSDNPLMLRCEDRRAGVFGFELATQPLVSLYAGRLIIQDPHVAVWRTLRRADVVASDSVAVATGPRGGFCVTSSCAVQVSLKPDYLMRWDLDPYAFLRTALDLEATPCPDVTTAWGRRVAFSSIDGDGLANRSQDLPGPVRYAGEVLRDEVLAHLPVPVTASFITGEIIKPGGEGEQLLTLARSIAALPRVQLGSHGHAHPLDWKRKHLALAIPGFTYSADAEITTSTALLNRLVAPLGRPSEIFLWTGDCRPGRDALAACASQGLLDLNGGDTRFDAEYPSVTGVAPLTRWIDGLRQVHAAASNENIYTNLWRENFGGFRKVIETFARCAAPRRLTPVHIYYHWYSGERQAALRAVQEVYAWSLRQDLCWLTTAEYAQRVRGFCAARLGRLADGWWIEPAGCPTLRCDEERRDPDPLRSIGVLGFHRHEDALYVTLDPTVARAELRFTQAQAATGPWLVASTSALRGVVRSGSTWRAEARCFNAGTLVLGGLKPGTRAKVRCQAAPAAESSADAEGRVSIILPAGNGDWSEVICGF